MQPNMGEFIEKLRKEKKITQKELGKALGVTDKTISKWENNVYLPDITMLSPLSEALGITLHELVNCKLNGEDENGNPIVDIETRKRKSLIKFLQVIIIILGSIILLLSVTIKKIKENEVPIDNTVIYKIISKDDRLDISGFIFEKGTEYYTVINRILIQNENLGTIEKFEATDFTLKINSDSEILAFYNSKLMSNSTFEELNDILKKANIFSEKDLSEKLIDFDLNLELVLYDKNNNKKVENYSLSVFLFI